MDFLKKFQNVENYTNFVNSDYFKLPNVSLTDEDYDVHYTNFISQGGEEEEETEPAVTLTYKVSSSNERVAFWNGGENIKRLYDNGEEIPIDPVEIVSETTEIPGSTFVFDGDTVTCPDSCFLTSVPSRITLAPKDDSVQINNDTMFLFIKRDLLDNNSTWVEFSEFIPYAGVGSVIDNKLVMDNPEFLSYINSLVSDDFAVTFALINGYSNAPMSLEADVNTASAEPEMQVLDIIMTTEVITGGVPTPFLFSYPGQHTVKMVLNNTDFGGNGMFSYYGNGVQEGSLLIDTYENSSENYCKLQSVVINDKVTSILPGTFYESSLYNVKIGSSVTSIGEEAFYQTSIETVNIPDSVTSIGDYAFQFCYDLRFVKFSKNLSTIGESTFESTWIGDIDLPASITYIGPNAFRSCGAINSVRINSNGNTVIDYYAFYDCNNLRQLTLAEGITRIGDYAFNETNITNIELPDSVVELGATPFSTSIGTIKLGAGITTIPNNMFKYCYNLKSVKIGNGVTSIGSQAFYQCSGLTSVVIPDSVTSIGNYAFQNCKGLTSVEIGSRVTSIGQYAFGSCSGLTSVVIPDSVTSIGHYAFAYCSGLTSVEIGNSVTSIGDVAFVDCTSLKKITCHAVTAPSISSQTFQNVSSLGKLIYPEGSDYSSWLSTDSYYLGYYKWNQKAGTIVATYNVTDTTNSTKLCNNISNFYSVYKIDGVRVTGDTSFTAYTFDTVGEHTVTFKELEIPIDMFYGTPCLKSVKISKEITSIGEHAFSNCSGLETIVVSSGNAAYDSRENCNCIIETSTNRLIAGCKNSFIPDSVTSIGTQAFYYCTSLTSVVIPDSVTSIGTEAFRNCSGLTSVEIGSGCTSIGSNAFYYCTSLTSVEIGNGCTSIGNDAFGNCSRLTEITCHAVTAPSIQSYTFYNVSTLGKLIYPEGSDYSSWLSTSSYYLGYYYWNETPVTVTCTYNVTTTNSTTALLNNTTRVQTMTVDGVSMTPSTSFQFDSVGEHNVEMIIIGYIAYKLFYNCTNLISVNIGDECTRIDDYAFSDCSGLTSVGIGSGVTSIGNYAFYNCTGLTSVVIPDSVTSIDGGAFYGCTSLPVIDNLRYADTFLVSAVDKTITSYTIKEGTKWIGNSAFNYCTGWTGELVIPDSVTSIGSSAFYNCTRLTNIVIPDSVTSIGGNVFDYCTRLTSVVIGSGVTRISACAFQNCSGLTSVVIPDSVISIGDYAFSSCSGLTSVVIPDSVTTIGNYAFQNCKGLKIITCHATTAPSIQNKTFYNIKTSGCLKYPEGSDYSSWLSTNSYYLGYYGWTDSIVVVNCTYNITTTDSETKLLHDTSEVLSMTVDGINITPSTSFQFDSIGEHNVEIGIVKKIPYNLFKECVKLTSVVIPNSVTSIDTYAFSGCTGLTSVVIPDSVTSIGGDAFQNCSGLASVVIPDSVISIGDYAFYYCTGLSSVMIGSGVTSIGRSTFSGCSGLTSVVIPDSVTSIGGDAFRNCSGLASVVIPDSVISIGSAVFYDCSGLTSVEIGSGVTSIGSSLFHNCSGLESIIVSSGNTTYDSRENCNCIIETSTNTLIAGCNNSFIPDSVISIGNHAFYKCSGLASVVIPDSVTSIGVSAFSGCTSLTSVVIPDSVTSLGDSAFGGCSGLTSVEIGSGMTSIGGAAFGGCINLREVTCHAVTAPSIGTNTFYNVKSNSTLYVPSGSDYSTWMSTGNYYLGKYNWFVKEIGVELPELTLDGYDVAMLVQPITTGSTKICNKTTSIAEIKVNDTILSSISTGYTFSEAYKWNVVRIKYTDGVTSIPSSCFSSCTRMYEVKIANSVTSLDSQAFSYCSGLTSVEIGSGVTGIGESTFYNCSGLTSVVIPDSVKSISKQAFCYCSGLTSVEIGSGVTSIGSNAFYQCSGLTSIVIPDSVTSIGTYAFSGCMSLTSVEIGSGVTSISESAFRDCSGLESIVVSSGNTVYDSRENCNCIIKTSTNTLIAGCKNSFIPNSVTSIGNSAFSSCSGLTSVVIPDSVTSIGSSAFTNCVGLTGELVIPDSVTSIGGDAFRNCSGLESLEIGSGCTSIGNESFWGCSGLKSIIVSSENTKYDSRENCNCLIETSINKIQQGSNNSFIPNSVTSIGQSAFSNCKGLTSMVIPDSVTSIDSHAFSGSGLKLVVIPDSVATIGNYTFNACSGLISVVIPDSVTSIGSYAFYECSGLTSIEIGDGCTSIGNYAFESCKGLTEITCHAVTAPSIQSYTFRNVNSNGTLYVPFGSNYSSWMSTSSYYLGYYNWTQQATYSPTECISLSITADDVNGRATKTAIYWTAVTNGVDLDGNPINNMTITGETISSEFPQNTSETETVERTITFEYMGVTASTTITQGVWTNASYTVDLNSQWQLSTSIANPDSAVYEGVYESFSNKGVNSSAAIMYIDILGYENFKFYVRSYAESCCDYVVVSNLDCTLTSGTTGGTNVKMTTKGSSVSSTSIDSYTLVEFSGIDGDEHRISVMYRKDSSQASGTDQGYVLIPKNQ